MIKLAVFLFFFFYSSLVVRCIGKPGLGRGGMSGSGSGSGGGSVPVLARKMLQDEPLPPEICGDKPEPCSSDDTCPEDCLCGLVHKKQTWCSYDPVFLTWDSPQDEDDLDTTDSSEDTTDSSEENDEMLDTTDSSEENDEVLDTDPQNLPKRYARLGRAQLCGTTECAATGKCPDDQCRCGMLYQNKVRCFYPEGTLVQSLSSISAN